MTAPGFSVSLDDLDSSAIWIGYEAARLAHHDNTRHRYAGGYYSGDPGVDQTASSLVNQALDDVIDLGLLFTSDAENLAGAGRNYQAVEDNLLALYHSRDPRPENDPGLAHDQTLATIIGRYDKEFDDTSWPNPITCRPSRWLDLHSSPATWGSASLPPKPWWLPLISRTRSRGNAVFGCLP